MTNKLGAYLRSVRACLRLDSRARANVTRELGTHLEDKVQELKGEGLSEEEAAKAAIESLGPPKLIAQQIYEAHSQGTWREAFLAALPHLLVASIFATYYWQNTLYTSIIILVIAGTVIYGWYHNEPVWVFPWLGYYLLPVIITGVVLIYLPQGWTWLAAFLYLPLALFVIIYIVRQTAGRDWLYVSLMLAPLPVVCAWLLSLGEGSELLMANAGLAQPRSNIPAIALSFASLGAASFTFIRAKQRWCKVAALLVPLGAILVSLVWVSRGSINTGGWLLLFLSLFVVTCPAWLELKSQQ